MSDQPLRGLSRDQLQEALDAGLPSLSSSGVSLSPGSQVMVVYDGRQIRPESFLSALRRRDGEVQSAYNPDGNVS